MEKAGQRQLPGQLLSRAELDAHMQALPHWRVSADGKAITRDFGFKNFKAAFAFMQRCAETAEAMNHHPDWRNVYNKVSVRLETHDAGGVTALDIALAKAMDEAAAQS